ncbi:Cuticle protein 6 [Gryllus bimaculatus]|nr:Cuticle protein 6 [Gryllus bimaculatus]
MPFLRRLKVSLVRLYRQARVETGLLDGSVRGAYSYIDANGKLINVQYLADNNGFRVLGANNLPEAPAANPLKGPEPVKDTPEVVAARAEFQKQFAEAAAAAAAAPEHSQSQSQSRRKRQVLLTPFAAPLHVPAVGKATVRVQQFEPVAGAKVPASTQKVELKESDKEVAVPLAYAAAPAPAAYVAAAPHVYSVAAPHVYSAVPQVYGVAPQVLAAHAPAPALAKATVKVQQYEPVDAKVPASTQKVELKETEQEVVAPIAYSHLPYYNIFG